MGRLVRVQLGLIGAGAVAVLVPKAAWAEGGKVRGSGAAAGARVPACIWSGAGLCGSSHIARLMGGGALRYLARAWVKVVSAARLAA